MIANEDLENGLMVQEMSAWNCTLELRYLLNLPGSSLVGFGGH